MDVFKPFLSALIITAIAVALFSLPQGYAEPRRYMDEISPLSVFIAVVTLAIILWLFFQ